MGEPILSSVSGEKKNIIPQTVISFNEEHFLTVVIVDP